MGSALAEFGGAAPVFRLESPVKVGVIPEATGFVYAGGPQPGAQHLLGNEQAFQCDVAVDTDAHHPGKFVGQMIFAHKELFGQTVQRKGLGIMVADVGDDPVGQGGLLFLRRRIFSIRNKAVQLYQKLQQQGLAQDVPPELVAFGLMKELVHGNTDRLLLLGRQPQQVGVCRAADVEAVHQAGVGGGMLMKKFRIDPQYDSLVGVPIRVDDGLVQLQRADQQKIPRLQPVGLALHQIVHTAAQKKVDLIKIMVVQRHRPQVTVLIMKDLVAVALHFLTGVEMLKFVWHGSALLPLYYTTRFTMPTAIFAILVVII